VGGGGSPDEGSIGPRAPARVKSGGCSVAARDASGAGWLVVAAVLGASLGCRRARRGARRH
jgi:hypothetical protein